MKPEIQGAGSVRIIVPVLVVASAILYWAGNGRISLWDRDEPRFAQPAKEMLFGENFRDLIVPHFNGEPFFHKPPWCYWQILLAYRLFGVNEFAARFFSGLWASLAVAVMFFFGRQWSNRVGLISAAAMATSSLLVVMAKLATADSTLLLFSLLAVFTLWRMYWGSAGVKENLILWTSVGIAVLIKGPAVFVVIVPLVVGLLILDRDRRWFQPVTLALGALLMLAVALPWYVVADRLADGALVERFVKYDILDRLGKPLEGHKGWPGFYIAAGLIDLWPWSAFLVPVVISIWRRRSEKIIKFLLCWLILPTLALEFISTKMVHYWLVVLPAYCLLLGFAADAWFGRDAAVWRGWSLPVRAVVAVAYILLGCAGCALIALTELVPGLLVLSVLLIVLPLAFTVFSGQAFRVPGRSVILALGAAGFSMVIFVLVGWLIVLAEFEKHKLGKQVADKMLGAGTVASRYALVGWREPSSVFYLHRGKDRVLVGSSNDLVKWAGRYKLIAAMPAEDYYKWVRARRMGSPTLQQIARVTGLDYTRGRWRELIILRSNPDHGHCPGARPK